MAKVVIYGLSIRTDRTDRQKGYTVCKECFTVGKSHLMECAFLGFCACVGLWFIERGILQLEWASLAVRIVRIERTVSLRTVRIERTVRHCALMS